MQQYLELLDRVYTKGKVHQNRTGVPTVRIVGGQIEHDMSTGFPLLTTRYLNIKGIIGEILGFLNKVTDAMEYQKLGCKFWLANATETLTWVNNPNRVSEFDLGRIYSMQWRDWRTADGRSIDQIKLALDLVMSNPESRRIIVQAWNPGELELMALPPCHTEWQLVPDINSKTMSLRWTQRSCDLYLGLPANIASYALLLIICCAATGYKPDMLIGQLTDIHLYENQLNNVRWQLEREPKPLAQMYLNIQLDDITLGDPVRMLDCLIPTSFNLQGYQSWPALPPVKMIA